MKIPKGSPSRSRSPVRENSAAGIYAKIAQRKKQKQNGTRRAVVPSITQKKEHDSPERSVEIRSRHESEGDKRSVVLDKRVKVKQETEHLTQRKILQQEAEHREIEQQSRKRIEEEVQKRIDEELARRRPEIEAEIERRISAMKDQIEDEVRTRVEQRVEQRLNAERAAAEEKKRKQEELEAIMEENKRRIQQQQAKVAEERLQQLEAERTEREERERRQLAEIKYQKAHQDQVLGKNGARPKLSFSFTKK